MSPRFRLATLLRVRRVQEQQARGRLAAAASAETLARAQVEIAATAYDGLPAQPPRADARAFGRDRDHRRAYAASIAAAARHHRARTEQTAEAREQWSGAAQRLSALERLAERDRAAARLAFLATEQRVTDEAAGGRRRRA